MIKSYYKSQNRDFTLLHGDSVKLMGEFDFKFDMIFADPPYFLSNGGISVQSGKVVCVDKGEWDKGGSPEHIDQFNEEWISACREHLKEDGTIWISGTYHNIFSVANKLTQLGFKILNVITWAKTNPPPNISCRYFTYSTEFVIWARKEKKVPHYYNYQLMKELNDDKQMTDVWRLPAIARWEKSQGKHPTQKPLALLTRIILASTKPGAWILDPFAGSGTTGIAANLLGRRFLGVDQEKQFLELSKARREELESLAVFHDYRHRIKDIEVMEEAVKPAIEEESVVEEAFIEAPTTTFSATFIQKRNALSAALPYSYDKERGIEVCHYLVDFDDKYVYVERDTWTESTFTQQTGRFEYKFDEATQIAELTSEFELMVCKWLTVDEAKKLEESRNMFAELDELRTYKREKEVADVFAQFPDLVENEQFKALLNDNTKFSVDELQRECYVIRGMVHEPTPATEQSEAPRIPVRLSANPNDAASYGGVFATYGIHPTNT